MKKIAIISEFNPFHKGHEYLLAKAKRKLKIDLCVSLMSGDFVQRGEPAIIDKYARARAAVYSGFDLVIEMPSFVSLQSASYFASESVKLIDKMGIDYLVFGIENLDSSDFLVGAEKILKNSNTIENKLIENLSKGISYTKSYNLAIKDIVGDSFISANNILALEYLRAIYKNGLDLKVCPVERIGSLNKDTNIKSRSYPSSTAIRNNIESDLSPYMPEASLKITRKFLNKYQIPNNSLIYDIFTYKLLIENKKMDKNIGYEEGMENLFKKIAAKTNGYEDFLSKASSKRYTKSRIRRLIINYILDNNYSLNNISYDFIKILAFNKNATKHFKDFEKNLKLIITKADSYKLNDEEKIIYDRNIKASNLYSILINRDKYYDFRHNNRAIF